MLELVLLFVIAALLAYDISEEAGLGLQAFAEVSDAVRADRYLSPHLQHYVREVRVVVYTQVRQTLRRNVARIFGSLAPPEQQTLETNMGQPQEKIIFAGAL